LLCYGYPEPSELTSWSKSSIATLQQIKLEPGAQEALHSQLRELEYQINEQRLVDVKVKEACIQNGTVERVETLKAIAGVGDVVASSFVAELFSPERFNNAGEVASYLGLAPVFRQSGEKQDRGRLRPVGQKRLRSLLVEAAWIWKSKDSEAAATYNRIYSKHGVAQKAIAALARKLAVLLWRRSLTAHTA
jgi:transposase